MPISSHYLAMQHDAIDDCFRMICNAAHQEDGDDGFDIRMAMAGAAFPAPRRLIDDGLAENTGILAIDRPCDVELIERRSKKHYLAYSRRRPCHC